MYSKTAPLLATGRKRQFAARRYLKRVKRRLICPYSQKKAFLSQLEDELFLSGADSEDAGWDALVARFGTPENAADEFMSGLEPFRQRRFLRRRCWVTAAVCAMFALGMTASLLYALHYRNFLNNIHFVEAITWKSDTLPEVTTPIYRHIVLPYEGNIEEGSEK